MGPEGTAGGLNDGAAAPQFSLLNRIGYALLRGVAALAIRPYFRLRLEGLEALPPGPFIIAANHGSYLDPVVLQAAMTDRRILYMMTREWYERPLLQPFFRFMHCIPVEAGGNNREALERCARALEAGHPIGIFPEGRVITDESLGPFHPGVAALAARTGAPVVPAAIIGARRALPKGRAFPSPHRITIRLGRPIEFGRDAAAADGGRRVRLKEATDRLRSRVCELLEAPAQG